LNRFSSFLDIFESDFHLLIFFLLLGRVIFHLEITYDGLILFCAFSCATFIIVRYLMHLNWLTESGAWVLLILLQNFMLCVQHIHMVSSSIFWRQGLFMRWRIIVFGINFWCVRFYSGLFHVRIDILFIESLSKLF